MLSEVLAALPHPEFLIVCVVAIFIAYTIFGIAAFGGSVISAPVLAQIMPVSMVVPIFAILDATAAITNGLRTGAKADRQDLILYVPSMMVGTLLGALLLIYLPTRVLMLMLGIFIIGYAAYGFFARKSGSNLARGWAVPVGTIGGMVGGLFGMGGPIHAMYFSRRFSDPDVIRTNQSALVMFSTTTRIVVFLFTGLYSNATIILLAALLVPITLLGTFTGHHLVLKMSRQRFFVILYSLLILSGSALILRAVL